MFGSVSNQTWTYLNTSTETSIQGGYFNSTTSNWMWYESGTDVTDFDWATGQPDSETDGSAIALSCDDSFLWRSTADRSQVDAGYICELARYVCYSLQWVSPGRWDGQFLK